MNIWDELIRRHVHRVIIRFSGGNDEGTIDEITLYDALGRVIQVLEPLWQQPKNDDERLAIELLKPINMTYGSFNGDFYVVGELVYEVENRHAYITGQEQTWQPFEMMVDVDD